MFCNQCGKEMPDGTKFCPNCGANQDGSSNSSYQSIPDVNKVIDSFADKNSDQLIDNETVICKAKWNIIPFIILWTMFFIWFFAQCSSKMPWDYSSYYDGFKIPLGFLYYVILFVSIIACALSIWLFVVRRELIVTNKKIYGRMGLIGTKQYIVPLKKINYINVSYTIISRLLNSATVAVVPGTIFGIRFNFISNAEELKKAIETQIYSKTN